MSYIAAKNAFRENVDRWINSDDDPALYNLNVGLFQLAEAIEQDFRQVQNTLSDLEDSLQRLKQR